MKTRPTGSRTREALFNILQSVDGFRMLDLFAGSGIMGIEALSRGAAHVVAEEMAHSQAHLLLQGYKALSLESKLTLYEKNALALDKEELCAAGGFDLIYADPPFKDMEYPDLRSFWQWLNPNGVAVFEAPSRNLPAWVKEASDAGLVQVRRYGESSLVICRSK
jgi:16S rRNA (guanine966-N2)-methyltransferase